MCVFVVKSHRNALFLQLSFILCKCPLLSSLALVASHAAVSQDACQMEKGVVCVSSDRYDERIFLEHVFNIRARFKRCKAFSFLSFKCTTFAATLDPNAWIQALMFIRPVLPHVIRGDFFAEVHELNLRCCLQFKDMPVIRAFVQRQDQSDTSTVEHFNAEESLENIYNGEIVV